MRMILSGPPHPRRCSLHLGTAAPSASTPSRTTMMFADSHAATPSTERASTHGSRVAALAARFAKQTITCPSLERKERRITLQVDATVPEAQTCPRTRNQLGSAPAACLSARASSDLEGFPWVLLRNRTSPTILPPHEPNADDGSKTPPILFSLLGQNIQTPKIRLAAGAAGCQPSECPRSGYEATSSSKMAHTAHLRLSARRLAI